MPAKYILLRKIACITHLLCIKQYFEAIFVHGWIIWRCDAYAHKAVNREKSSDLTKKAGQVWKKMVIIVMENNTPETMSRRKQCNEKKTGKETKKALNSIIKIAKKDWKKTTKFNKENYWKKKKNLTKSIQEIDIE